MVWFRSALVVIFLFTVAIPLATADNIYEAGTVVGFGTGYKLSNTERYDPVLLALQFGMDMKKMLPDLEGHKGHFFIFAEPQANPVNNMKYYELGFAVGIKYMYPVTVNFLPFVMASVGTHYISMETQEQGNGFLFSDTLGVGVYYMFKENMAFDAGYRLRHLSNAGLRSPNDGLNCHIGTVGFSYFFE